MGTVLLLLLLLLLQQRVVVWLPPTSSAKPPSCCCRQNAVSAAVLASGASGASQWISCARCAMGCSTSRCSAWVQECRPSLAALGLAGHWTSTSQALGSTPDRTASGPTALAPTVWYRASDDTTTNCTVTKQRQNVWLDPHHLPLVVVAAAYEFVLCGARRRPSARGSCAEDGACEGGPARGDRAHSAWRARVWSNQNCFVRSE